MRHPSLYAAVTAFRVIKILLKKLGVVKGIFYLELGQHWVFRMLQEMWSRLCSVWYHTNCTSSFIYFLFILIWSVKSLGKQLQCKAEVSGNNHIMVSQRKCLHLCSEIVPQEGEIFFSFPTFWHMWCLSPGDFYPVDLMLGILSISPEGYIPVQMKPAEKNLQCISLTICFQKTLLLEWTFLKTSLLTGWHLFIYLSRPRVHLNKTVNGGDEGRRKRN